MHPLEEKTYTLDGIKMTYYEAGHGPTLLFLHGAGIRALTYKKSLLELAKHFHLYAPDLPGFGKSDMPPLDWTFTEYANFFNSFIQTRNLSNLILIGHSFGGRIALELAAQSPNITNLILVDTTLLAKYYINSKYHLPKLILNTSLEIFLERNPTYAKIAFDVIFNLRRHGLAYHQLKKSIYTALKSQSTDVYKITIPTLILWGEKDKVVPLQIAYEIQKEIAGSKVKIIKGANHAWCFTKPDVLLQEIQHFLALSSLDNV